VTRFITGKPLTMEDVWARFYRMIGHWRVRSYGYWIVLERETGRMIGEVGFGEMRRALDLTLQGLPELGWVLRPESHGRGYATEAASAALDWIDGRHSPERTLCLIAPANLASIRVARKCGYTELVHTVYKDSPAIIFERRHQSATT
jgi:RimJ/RimL family protein N-acetyltransferase